MKRIAIALVLVSLAIAIPVLARHRHSGSRSDDLERGAPIAADAQSVTVTQLLETPGVYENHPVVVEGVISKVCRLRGCWMELAPEAGEGGIRVTFKGFTVPTDSKGMKARVAGVARVKTEEGKPEVSFVASGVELRE
jgi:hypothetical protein